MGTPDTNLAVLTSDESDYADLDLVAALPDIPWTKWKPLLRRLYQHPGQWARVRFKIPHNSAAQVVQAVNHGGWLSRGKRYRMTPPGIFRAAMRNNELYVCYCGPEPISPATLPTVRPDPGVTTPAGLLTDAVNPGGHTEKEIA